MQYVILFLESKTVDKCFQSFGGIPCEFHAVKVINVTEKVHTEFREVAFWRRLGIV